MFGGSVCRGQGEARRGQGGLGGRGALCSFSSAAPGSRATCCPSHKDESTEHGAEGAAGQKPRFQNHFLSEGARPLSAPPASPPPSVADLRAGQSLTGGTSLLVALSAGGAPWQVEGFEVRGPAGRQTHVQSGPRQQETSPCLGAERRGTED